MREKGKTTGAHHRHYTSESYPSYTHAQKTVSPGTKIVALPSLLRRTRIRFHGSHNISSPHHTCVPVPPATRMNTTMYTHTYRLFSCTFRAQPKRFCWGDKSCRKRETRLLLLLPSLFPVSAILFDVSECSIQKWEEPRMNREGKEREGLKRLFPRRSHSRTHKNWKRKV